jgi:hypothetical protein|nr:MAG TPA: hypothetical protein [Caudoviricetes sp.]
MTKTKYYDLQMDDPQDDYDVDVVNANLKKIDEQMKTRENATDALQEPEFTVAAKRENIASKEKMPKILGKIAKFFADLKTVAFSGKYNDLDGKPAIVNNNTTTEPGSALDARQANPNIEGTMAASIAQINSNLNIVPINIVKTSSKVAYISYEFLRVGHIGWYNMWLTYAAIQGADRFEEVVFKFPDDISVRYITGGACSAYGETTHGGIDSIIYSTEHTLSVRVAGAINAQTFGVYATGMFLIN